MATQVVERRERAPYRKTWGDTRDRYMEKARETADPIIRKAMERMVWAAGEAFSAREQLRLAMVDLERHPDYLKTERARKEGRPAADSLTLAWWVHNCAHGALHDAELDEAGDWLLVDADPRRAQATLRQFIRDDIRDRKRFQPKRTRRARGAAKNVVQIREAAAASA